MNGSTTCVLVLAFIGYCQGAAIDCDIAGVQRCTSNMGSEMQAQGPCAAGRNYIGCVRGLECSGAMKQQLDQQLDKAEKQMADQCGGPNGQMNAASYGGQEEMQACTSAAQQCVSAFAGGMPSNPQDIKAMCRVTGAYIGCVRSAPCPPHMQQQFQKEIAQYEQQLAAVC